MSLSVKDRTVDSCLDMFIAMCDHAFTPRLKGIPFLSQLIYAIGSGRKYKTKPLHAALKTAFGEEEDLFGFSSQFRSGARVAVTSSSATTRESMLLANYRRPDDPTPSYAFERPHEPDRAGDQRPVPSGADADAQSPPGSRRLDRGAPAHRRGSRTGRVWTSTPPAGAGPTAPSPPVSPPCCA